jgi:hypothetical protein
MTRAWHTDDSVYLKFVRRCRIRQFQDASKVAADIHLIGRRCLRQPRHSFTHRPRPYNRRRYFSPSLRASILSRIRFDNVLNMRFRTGFGVTV